MSGEEKQLYTLTEYISNVIENNGSYTNYIDTLIENDNPYSSLATKDTYEFFQKLYDKRGRITTNDTQGRTQLPVKLISFSSQKLAVSQPDSCSTTDKEEAKNLCSCFRVANAYHQLVQKYIVDIEQYAVDMATYSKAVSAYNKWLKKQTGDRPELPELPEAPVIPDTPAISCCEERFSSISVDDASLGRDLHKCLLGISQDISKMEEPKPPKTQIVLKAQAQTPPSPPPPPPQDYNQIIIAIAVLVFLIILNATLL
jgi:hypothetical protein